MLYYSPQIWCSDNTDAIARMKIQYGTSLAYPASCVGSHVSVIPNHITGNSTRARTRCLVAMCGTFGFELDMNELNWKDKNLYLEHIKIFRNISPIIRNGDLYRLWDPFKVSCQLVSEIIILLLIIEIFRLILLHGCMFQEKKMLH